MHRSRSWGRGWRAGPLSPLLLFIGSLTTARTAAEYPPLSCLPRLPPLSPSAARRNSMPIRFAARRPRDQSRAAAGAGESAAGGGQCFPAPGTSRASHSSPGRGSDSREGWLDCVVQQSIGTAGGESDLKGVALQGFDNKREDSPRNGIIGQGASLVKRLGGRIWRTVVQKPGRTGWLGVWAVLDWQEAMEGSGKRVGLRISLGFQDSSSSEVP